MATCSTRLAGPKRGEITRILEIRASRAPAAPNSAGHPPRARRPMYCAFAPTLLAIGRAIRGYVRLDELVELDLALLVGLREQHTGGEGWAAWRKCG